MIRFGPRRSHPLIIFHNFFKNFGLLLALLAFSFITKNFDALLDNLALPIIVLVAPISRLFSYLFTTYTIDDEKLFIEKGLLNRKKIELPLSTVTSVDFTQSLVFQMAGVFLVNVENAAGLQGNQTKIQLALRSETALEAKELLLGVRAGEPGQGAAGEASGASGERAGQPGFSKTYDPRILSRRAATFGEILLMGVLQAKGLVILQVLSIAAVVISFGSQLFLQESVDGETFILDWFSRLSGLATILIVFAILYTVGLVFSVAMTTLKYFGFTLTDREDSLYVEYGLLTRRTHTLMKKQISGAAYKQPFLMGLAKAGVLEVYVAGYSLEEDNAPKDPTLFPLVREKELAEFLRRHVPAVSLPESYERPAGNSLPYFFLCPRFVLSLLLFLVTLGPVALPELFRAVYLPWMDVLWLAGLLILAFAVASVLLEKSRTGIDSQADQVSLSLGGFTRRQVFLRPEKVESVRENGSLRKKDKNIANVLVHILAAPAYSGHRVRNVSLDAFRRTAACLKY